MKTNIKRLLSITVISALCLFGGYSMSFAGDSGLLTHVKNRLITDGYDRETIENLYSKPAVEFSPKCIMLFFPKSVSTGKPSPPSKTSMHEQFLTPAAIGKAKNFIVSNRSTLKNAEQQYGVDYQVITAIILVETGFGANTGSWPVINSLSTLAALGDSDTRKAFWDMMPAERKHSWDYYESRASKKSEWAYGELKAFLDLAIMAGAQTETITGSYAGAVGIPQFMPSNILSLGKDGDNDGFIDLFNYNDAIFSVANYFRESGWRRGIEHDKAFNVVLRYNKSGTYARTVLEIANRLKGV